MWQCGTAARGVATTPLAGGVDSTRRRRAAHDWEFCRTPLAGGVDSTRRRGRRGRGALPRTWIWVPPRTYMPYRATRQGCVEEKGGGHGRVTHIHCRLFPPTVPERARATASGARHRRLAVAPISVGLALLSHWSLLRRPLARLQRCLRRPLSVSSMTSKLCPLYNQNIE